MDKLAIEDIFYVQFENSWYKKGDILEGILGQKAVVLKTYNSWWRRLLYPICCKIGIKMKFNIAKLKFIE